MLAWLTNWRRRQCRVRVDADELMRLYGERAYDEADARAQTLHSDTSHRNKHWNGVRREIGQRDFVAVSRCLIVR